MKLSSFDVCCLFSLLFTVSGAAAAASTEERFSHCLINNSRNSDFPISKAIYGPNNASFQSVLSSYIRNLRYMTPTTPKPLAIVTANHESHIQTTIFCAKKLGLQIRIRSGGHDLEGLSFVADVPFVILDMFNLRAIDIDIANGTGWVYAGATLGEVYYRIGSRSKVHAFPGGVCFTLGTGGHFSGGGYGNLMRKYGLSVDNVDDAVIIDVNGRILDRKAMGEDLFWAIRGGGAASFGVVLSWKIRLVPVPETVTVFRVQRTLEQGATDVVHRWQEVADKLHEDLFIRVRLEVVNGTRKGEKTVRASFIALFLGQAKALVQLMEKSFPELGLQQKDCIETTWLESTLFWYDFPKGTSTEVMLNRTLGQIYAKNKSDFLKEPIPKTGLEALWKKMIELQKVSMHWNPYGGKMSDISESATPFPHRAGIICKIQYYEYWTQPGIETTNKYLNLSRELYEFMAPYVSKSPREAFFNYRDLDIGANSDNKTDYNRAREYGEKYFKSNFDRLVQVKTRVDPENFFKNEQSIPTLPK